MDSELKQAVAQGCIVGFILVGIMSIFRNILDLFTPDPPEKW